MAAPTANKLPPQLGGPPVLSLRQILSLVALGVVFAVLAGLAIRFSGLAILDGDIANVILYLALIPSAWILAFVSARFANLDPERLVGGVAIMVATAIVIESIALVWFPDLYLHGPIILLRGAAALLWGAGAALAASVVMQRP